MIQVRSCPKCAKALAQDLSDGLCPDCMLQAVLLDEPADLFGAENTQAPQVPTDLNVTASIGPRGTRNDFLIQPGENFGRYHIIRVLGKGGMGEVFEAEDTEARRRVALKVLKSSHASPEGRQRFLREGRLAAAINHPHSTYIYGTEEIDGVMVICMELVPGGTLKDLVEQKGSLPVIEAVDSILQVISGLEAIQAHGIVHRDIKPANCLLDGTGVIKVGDFGLSTAIAGTDENSHSLAEYFKGTPAFSSPEQLRGEKLDVRSDIYSVGVTLYYLLTGRTPFKAGSMASLIETVCRTPPLSPRKIRGEIPNGLAQVVLRCLEKDPQKRFGSYNELRRALQPFASPAPAAATLPRRGMAAAVDNMILFPICAIIAPHTFQLALFVVSLIYYSFTEGVFRRSIGGALVGLQVVGPSGVRMGIPRAFLRTFCFIIILSLPAEHAAGFVIWRLIWLLILFSTATPKNGLSGLHDLISHSRVLGRPNYRAPRPLIAERFKQTTQIEVTNASTLGPYSLTRSLRKHGDADLLLGADSKLQRDVWIESLPAGAPPLSEARRKVCRAGRPRWVNSVRSGTQCWDAYEATSGVSLVRLMPNKQPWEKVRYWLLDLAEELSAAMADQSLPRDVALDRVWLGKDGHAKLLDFPAPDVDDLIKLPPSIPVNDARSARLFLNQTAVSLLEGRLVGAAEVQGREVAVPIPLHAREFLNELRVPDPLVLQLRALPDRPAAVSLAARLGMVSCLTLVPLLVSLPWTGVTLIMQQEVLQHPKIVPLHLALERLPAFSNAADSGRKQALEIYIASHFRDTITDNKTWSTAYAQLFMQNKRGIAENILSTHTELSQEESAEADAQVDRYIKSYKPEENANPAATFLSTALKSLCLISGLGSVLCPLFLRQSPLSRLFGVAFVATDGSVVAWLRVAFRNFIAWLPIFLAVSLELATSNKPGASLLLLILLGIFLAGGIWSVFSGGRSIQDRIAGTNLVPY